MSAAFENGGVLGKTLDYRSTTLTSYEDEANSAANCEVIETRSVNFSTLTGDGADDTNVGATGSTTLSSTLQAGDIVVVMMFLDVGNASSLVSSGSSWAYPSNLPTGSSSNIFNINTLLAYKVVTSGNETLDATVGFNASDSRGGAAIVVIRGGTVSSSIGGAVDIQANYSGGPSAASVTFPSLSGAPSDSVALLFSFLDDQPFADDGANVSTFPSGYTTAGEFDVGTDAGNGGRFYFGYQENVTATGTPSITFSGIDGIIGVSVLISRDIAGRSAKTSSGVWNTEAVYDDNAFDAVSATTRNVTGVSTIGNKSVYLSSENGNPISNTITFTCNQSIYSGHQTLVAMIHAESDTGTITEPTVTATTDSLTYNGSVEDDNVGARTSTFTNLPIGGYASNRVVYLLFSTDFQNDNNGNDITGVTVDGQPATEIFVQVADTTDARWWGSMWKFSNTTGTTANVVITAATGGLNFDYNVVSSYSAYGYKDTVEQTVLHYKGASGDAGIQNGDVTVTANVDNSMILGLAIGNSSGAFNFTSTDATITTDKVGTVSGDRQEHASAVSVAAGDVVITDSLGAESHNQWLKAFIVVSPDSGFGNAITKDASIIGGSSNNIHTGIYRTNTAGLPTTFTFQYDNDVENVGVNVYEVGPATIVSTGATDVLSQPAFITSNAVSGATGSGLSATLNGITTNNCVALVSGYVDHSNSSTTSTFSTTSGTLTEINSVFNANSSLNLGQGDFGIVNKPAVSGVTIDYTSDIDNPNGVLAAAIYGSSQETPNAGTVTALTNYAGPTPATSLSHLNTVSNTAGASITLTNVTTGTTGTYNHFIIAIQEFVQTTGDITCSIDGGSALTPVLSRLDTMDSGTGVKQYVWLVPSISNSTANVTISGLTGVVGVPAHSLSFYNLTSEFSSVVQSNTVNQTATTVSAQIGTTTDINAAIMMVFSQNDTDATSGETFVNGSSGAVTFSEDSDVDIYTNDRAIFYHSTLPASAKNTNIHTFSFGNAIDRRNVTIIGFQ